MPMRLPARLITGNLVWARTGSVWALYRVACFSYPWLSDSEKLSVHHRVSSALMGLPENAMILSLCQPCSPWVTAEPAGFVRRTYLAAELPRARSELGGGIGPAAARVLETFGVAATPPPARAVRSRARQAESLAAELSAFIHATPVPAEEIRWIYSCALGRGMQPAFFDPSWEVGGEGGGDQGRGAIQAPALAALGDWTFKEGGHPQDQARPRHRRYLRVESDDAVAFQTFLAVSDMPHRFAFPGSEWLHAAGHAPFPVDWCVRIRSIPNQEAQARTKRQARQLSGQAGEYEGEPAGAPHSLAEAIDGIQELRARLAASPADPELQATTILCIASADLAELEGNAAFLRGLFTGAEYDVHRPTGGQLALFEAMLPGSDAGATVRDYSQHLLAKDLAAGMPFAGIEIGDPGGMLLGASLDSGIFAPVRFDPAYGPSINHSGSVGAFGSSGAGKSFFIKSVALSTLASGGRVLALDRTQVGEYVRLAEVVPGRAEVVRLGAGSPVCMDPLRIFEGEERSRIAIGFLTLLTGASPTDLQGSALAEAVRLAADQGRGMAGVLAALEPLASSDPDASAVLRKLKAFSRAPLARLVFGDDPPLSLAADYIVFHAPGLSLPDRQILASEYLSRQILPDQIFSQALIYLVAAISRSVIFSDPSRFAAALFDEAWSLTSSLQGRALLLEAIRDGRKHNASVWLLSQHPHDLGDDELSHLLGNRFVFRQARGAGPAACGFMGIEASERAIRFLESAREGQCLYRDVAGRVGAVQILAPEDPAVLAAFDTNPSGEEMAG